MNAKTRILLSLALACLWLLPRAAVGQSTVGPFELLQYFSGFGGAYAGGFIRAGNLAYFRVGGFYVPQTLWRSDGTSQGTFAIGLPAPTEELRYWTTAGDRLFFTWFSDPATRERRLFRSDGTTAGTIPLTQGLSLALDSSVGTPPTSLAVPETELVFFSAGAVSQQPDFELWATDGTPEGTRLVKDVNPDGPSSPSFMVSLGGQLYFLADTPGGRELWRSDGTPDGTVRVLEVPGLRLFGYAVAGRHFFVTVNGAAFQSKEFWAADGTTGGVGRILRATTEVRPDMIPIGDNVVFTLSDSQYGLEPWWSDGTPAGTHRIADLCPGPCNSFFGATPYGGRAMLLADDGTSGLEPWLTDGTAAGTRRLGDLCPGACDSELFDSAEVNGWLILVSSLGVWLSDGSADGAFQINSGRSLSGDPISFWATELILLPHHLLIATQEPSGSGFAFGGLWSLPVTAPLVPAGDWLTSDRVPGFRFKVRIAGAIPGRPEPACIAETLCVSGALPGRTEVFVRVIGPRPNGYLWPTLVRFTPSLVEVWIEQTKTGTVRHYRLNGLSRDDSDLSGLVDRQGFRP